MVLAMFDVSFSLFLSHSPSPYLRIVLFRFFSFVPLLFISNRLHLSSGEWLNILHLIAHRTAPHYIRIPKPKPFKRTAEKQMKSDWNSNCYQFTRFVLNYTKSSLCEQSCGVKMAPTRQPPASQPANRQHDMNNCTVWLLLDLMERWRSLIHYIPFAQSFISTFFLPYFFAFHFICLILIHRLHMFPLLLLVVFIVLWNIIIVNCNMAWWICACNLFDFSVVLMDGN